MATHAVIGCLARRNTSPCRPRYLMTEFRKGQALSGGKGHARELYVRERVARLKQFVMALSPIRKLSRNGVRGDRSREPRPVQRISLERDLGPVS